MYHYAVAQNLTLVFETLTQAKKEIDLLDLKDEFDETPTNWAQKYGRWEIFEKMLFAKMGDKMKEKADLERNRIEKQNGIIRQFLNEINNKNSNNKETETKTQTDSNAKQSMQFLLNTLIQLIEARLPISDDLLLLCWRWELQTSLVFVIGFLFFFCLVVGNFFQYPCAEVVFIFDLFVLLKQNNS